MVTKDTSIGVYFPLGVVLRSPMMSLMSNIEVNDVKVCNITLVQIKSASVTSKFRGQTSEKSIKMIVDLFDAYK